MHVVRRGLIAAIVFALLLTGAGCRADHQHHAAPTNSAAAPRRTQIDPRAIISISVPMPIHGGRPPTSTGTPINAVSFASDLIKSNTNAWGSYFREIELTMPKVNAQLLSMGDAVATGCNAERIDPSYVSMLYCSVDTGGNGAIFIPMDLLGTSWVGVDRTIGDVAAAVTLSRLVATVVVRSISNQLGLLVPAPADYRLASTCLAGAWAHTIYPFSGLSPQQVQAGVSKSVNVPFQVNTDQAPASADALAIAWTSGYTDGVPANCVLDYWKS